VVQSAAINTNGVNMMADVEGHVLQYRAAMWFSVGDMYVTNVLTTNVEDRFFFFFFKET
jgi:hypothetical protein